MTQRTIGNALVDKITDLEGPSFTAEFLLPGADLAEIRALYEAVGPRFVDPVTEALTMSFHSFVIRTGRHTILVDACIGDHKERPGRPPWHHRQGPYLENLRAAGIELEAVDFVLCTHLHADHVGWNTRLVDGRWVPTFPNARYLFARRELAFWEELLRASPGENHDSYQDSVLPVIEAGRAVIVESDHQIDGEMWLEDVAGHTPGSVILNLVSAGEKAMFVGDVVHHPLQCLRPDWSSRFCHDPVQSAIMRRRVLETAAESGAWFLTGHFATPTFGHIRGTGDGFRFES